MTQTRSMDSISELIDQKLNEFKTSFMAEILAILGNTDEKKNEIEVLFEEKKNEFINNTEEYLKSIRAIENHVRNLQLSNDSIKAQNIILTNEIDDLQQYGRRPNIRIFGVKTAGKESEEDVINIVSNIIQSVGGDVRNDAIDRGHRVG